MLTLTEANPGIEPGTLGLSSAKDDGRPLGQRAHTQHHLEEAYIVCEWFTPHFIYNNTQHTTTFNSAQLLSDFMHVLVVNFKSMFGLSSLTWEHTFMSSPVCGITLYELMFCTVNTDSFADTLISSGYRTKKTKINMLRKDSAHSKSSKKLTCYKKSLQRFFLTSGSAITNFSLNNLHVSSSMNKMNFKVQRFRPRYICVFFLMALNEVCDVPGTLFSLFF